MRITVAGLMLVFAALLAGCSEPLPLEKREYAGDWRSSQMRLLITAEGRCEYSRQKEGGGVTSINAPILEFEGDNFVVGVGMIKTTFVVSKPPRLVDGQWRMTVDGVDLVRVGVGSGPEVRT